MVTEQLVRCQSTHKTYMDIYKRVLGGVAAFSLLLGLARPIPTLAAGPASVNLLSAGNFTLLAKTGISTTGSSMITGDIGVSPAAATSITGFALNLAAESAF